jgi:hypothetical protein
LLLAWSYRSSAANARRQVTAFSADLATLKYASLKAETRRPMLLVQGVHEPFQMAMKRLDVRAEHGGPEWRRTRSCEDVLSGASGLIFCAQEGFTLP